MLGTLLWRLQEAFAVITGKKKTQETKTNKQPIKEWQSPEQYLIENRDLQNLIDSVSIEFLFSEFGENRINSGGNNFSSISRLDPTLSSLKKYFPNAKYTVYSDFEINIPGVNVIKVTSPINDHNHPRHLYRTADYFKFISLISSDADFKCVIDSDMFITSPEVYTLVYLTKTFGFCAPSNPRNLLKKDMKVSMDTFKINDLSGGLGHSYNQSPMTLWKNDKNGISFFKKCAGIMEKEPSRASLVMWKVARDLGISPYLLPKEWCVCGEDVGIGDEVILHKGHSKVEQYYNTL
ncbi:hypothetical protein IQ37_00340 [Chryseobacterium piperi]|uniref:Nucleotide-diphospho-sugar transferase domain-containing protein n=1 Tax=Chryseobacterium piperi TaxID=558152 RepID=A0A086BMV2_9FLAO|nr:hypothetical protein [Chryseobacterium piperi]ASW75060.1 hypothetical protein CJF12_12745 [Chryseobacterium piperi]KFF30266.1 hypothetical protein IQ37_00340 [Chryseobacterium piperi]